MKRNFLLFLGFLLFSNCLFAQTSKTKLGLKILPQIATITPSDIDGHDLSLSRFSLSEGITFIKSISEKNLSIESGVYFLNQGIGADAPDLNGQTVSAKENYYYLSIPVSLRIGIKDFYVAAGLSFDYYLYRTYVQTSPFAYTEKSDVIGTPKINYGLVGAFGIEKSLNEHLNWFAELNIHRMLNYERLTGKFLNYGLGLGINYKIN